MRDNKKIIVYPGNVLRVKSDLLVLYEVRSYSQVYRRLMSALGGTQSTKNETIQNTHILFYRLREKSFSSLCVIDTISKNSTTNFKIMEEVSKFLIPLLPSQFQSSQTTISFNLAEGQDTENLKYLIDKIMSIRPIHAILAGTPMNTNHMLSHLNQSGHLLSNTAINTPSLISDYFNHIICKDCKKIDLQSRCSADLTQVYCKTCSGMHSAYTNNKYLKKCLQYLKDKCYCQVSYKLGEREAHLNNCTTAVFCCEKCEFYSGQYDFARHYVENHMNEVYERMNDMWKKKVDKNIKAQCQKCGTFYPQDQRCGPCLQKEMRAKLHGK